MQVIVNVTQDDIDLGEREDCRRCPIARALLRAFPGLWYAKAEMSSLTIRYLDRDDLLFRVPEEVILFMDAFDHRRYVTPFSFTLDIPAPATP